MQNYERLVARRNPRSQDLLLTNALTKLDVRISRLPPLADDLIVLRLLQFKMQHMYNNSHFKHSSGRPMTAIYESESDSAGRWDTVISQRGAIIDMYGPGTVYHRNKMRDLLIRRRLVANKLFGSGGRDQISNSNNNDSKPSSIMSLNHPDDKSQDTVLHEDEASLGNLEQRIIVWHSETKQEPISYRKPVSCVRLRRVDLDVCIV